MLRPWATNQAARRRSHNVPQLVEFIPKVSPHFAAPHHLAPILEILEDMDRGPVRAVINVPPQHGKSETLLHWIARRLLTRPERLMAYITYAAGFARSQSRKARRYAIEAGVQIDNDANRLEHWLTKQGGGLIAMGVGGPLTGQPPKELIVDDPIKNRQEAESAVVRQTVWEWISDSVLPRLHPDSSVIVCQTRWHVDDPSARLVKLGWRHINLPAISPSGQALWPEERPIEFLEQQRAEMGEYSFASLYQGEPRPRGGVVFGLPSIHTGAPPPQGRFAIGLDLAYSEKTHADYSVAVVLQEFQGIYWVRAVHRAQVQAPDFLVTALSLQRLYPSARCAFYAHGTEKGSSDLMAAQGLRVDVMPATADKFNRAQKTAAAWNAGKIHTCVGNWTEAFVDELSGFSGVRDVHDDQVDALVAAFDVLRDNQLTGEKLSLSGGDKRAMNRLGSLY